jgi:hypothetical protein
VNTPCHYGLYDWSYVFICDNSFEVVKSFFRDTKEERLVLQIAFTSLIRNIHRFRHLNAQCAHQTNKPITLIHKLSNVSEGTKYWRITEGDA